MYHLLRLQILVSFFICFSSAAFAQVKELYRLERDNKPFYFGLSLGSASAFLSPTKSPDFLKNDSILSVDPSRSSGYSVRLLATARLTKHWEFRTNPGLILGIERAFTYTLGKPQLFEDTVSRKRIQSNIATFPFHFKFHSDRINNFKVYLIGGIKYDIDLASNASNRNAEDLIKLKQFDFGAELGIGFSFYLRYVTVSPEIKLSNGFSNLHARDANLKYSNILNQLNSRMVMFTLHLEE